VGLAQLEPYKPKEYDPEFSKPAWLGEYEGEPVLTAQDLRLLGRAQNGELYGRRTRETVEGRFYFEVVEMEIVFDPVLGRRLVVEYEKGVLLYNHKTEFLFIDSRFCTFVGLYPEFYER
jgi:hypothetical protein